MTKEVHKKGSCEGCNSCKCGEVFDKSAKKDEKTKEHKHDCNGKCSQKPPSVNN